MSKSCAGNSSSSWLVNPVFFRLFFGEKTKASQFQRWALLYFGRVTFLFASVSLFGSQAAKNFVGLQWPFFEHCRCTMTSFKKKKSEYFEQREKSRKKGNFFFLSFFFEEFWRICVQPDRPFPNFRAWKSVARRSWTKWNWRISWSWCSKIVKRSVGYYMLVAVLRRWRSFFMRRQNHVMQKKKKRKKMEGKQSWDEEKRELRARPDFWDDVWLKQKWIGGKKKNI